MISGDVYGLYDNVEYQPPIAFFAGATISIQETVIRITEGTNGPVCIVLESAMDGLERDVSVTLTTTAGTAGT